MKPKLLSLGTMYVDIHALHFPFDDALHTEKEVVGNQYEIVPGGSALGFANFCTKLGIPTAFIGKVGNDDIGKLLEQIVENAGIIPAFIVDNGVQTSIAINFANDNGKGILTVIGNANQTLSIEDIHTQFKNFSNVSYLYLGGVFKLKRLLPRIHDLVMQANQYGMKVFLDHGRVTQIVTEEDKEYIKQVISNVDYYLPSKDEFLNLWNVESIEEGLEVFKDKITKVIVKDGKNGAYTLFDNQVIHIASFPVEVHNPIGAGDTFNAGFIKALDIGLALEQSIRFACATAALKISTLQVPSVDKIKELAKL